MIFLKMSNGLCNSHWNTRSNDLAWGQAKLIFSLEAEIPSVLCSVQLQMHDLEIRLRRAGGDSRQRLNKQTSTSRRTGGSQGCSNSAASTISSSCLLGLRGAESLFIFCEALRVPLCWFCAEWCVKLGQNMLSWYTGNIVTQHMSLHTIRCLRCAPIVWIIFMLSPLS